jgi:hypothetical protein
MEAALTGSPKPTHKPVPKQRYYQKQQQAGHASPTGTVPQLPGTKDSHEPGSEMAV